MRAPSNQEIIGVAQGFWGPCDSIILTGSFASRRTSLTTDIDVMLLSRDVPPTQVLESTSEELGIPLTAVAYNVDYFNALLTNDNLLFFNLREARKLLFGVVLHDPDLIAQRTIVRLRSAEISHRRLQDLHTFCAVQYEKVARSGQYSIEFATLIETICFIYMHRRIDIQYSKHKYLLTDAKNLSTKALFELLASVAAHYRLRVDVHNVANRFKIHLNRTPLDQCCGAVPIVDDAFTLLQNGRSADAVFPLRYAALKLVGRTCAWKSDAASQLETEQVPDIVAEVLRLEELIEPDVMKSTLACLNDLGNNLALQQ
jgi:hypothetical protein